MSLELPPALSATLANRAYDINGNNPEALKFFLKNKVFSQQKDKNLLSAAVGGRILRAATDGFGICAEGAGPYKNDLFLIFRGTTDAHNKADWVTDARIGITLSNANLPVHIGFNQTFNSMLPDIRRYIIEAKVTGAIHCIGHSLGGAVALLAADWISRNTINHARLYTFGAPRVGTEWFVRSTTNEIVASNLHRVYHRTDPVPMIALYPFMHTPGYFIDSTEPLTSGMAHKMEKYIESVEGKSWEQLAGIPDQPYTVESAIESWLKSKSPVNGSDSTFWRWIESALIYVIKKPTMKGIVALQSVAIGAFTLADKIAYILAEGIELADNISIWVEHLMRKMMQALGMKIVKAKEELTRSLIRSVLRTITEMSNNNAKNALRIL